MSIATLLCLALACPQVAADDADAEGARLRQVLALLAERPMSVELIAAYEELHARASRLGDAETARAAVNRLVEHAEATTSRPDLATRLNNLAILLYQSGDYAGARPLHERALAIREAARGPEHPDVAESLNNLAELLRQTGDYAEARPLHERALAIWEAALGPEHPDVAAILNNLAELLRQTGDYAGARPLLERALAIHEAALGSEHVHTSETLMALGTVRHRMGESQPARELLQRALAIHERALGADHPGVTAQLRSLAALLHEEGDLDAALPLLERALVIDESSFGGDDPASAASRHAMAAVLVAQGRLLPALRHAERALEIRLEQLGATHPDTARSRQVLGAIMADGGDPERARELLEQALDGLVRALGSEHPDTVACMGTLAGFLDGQGELEAAGELLEKVLVARQDRLGSQHVLTLEAEGQLADLRRRQGRLDDARDLYEAVLARREEALPDDHELLQETREALAVVLDELGEDAASTKLRGAVREPGVYPPLIVVRRPDASDMTTEERRVDLDVVVTDYAGVQDVKIEQDGQQNLATTRSGALELDATGERAQLTYPIWIPNPQNETRATVTAVNRLGLESEPASFVIRYEPPQRDLYVLAMGVADYDDDAMDLAYPVRDVEDIVARLGEEVGRFYDEVHVETLVDGEVKTGAVRRLRESFLRKAQPEDTILVFAAGHGVRTEVGDYYFLTQECTADDPYSGVDRTTLESLVTWDKLYAKRRVLLLDTCHAGSAMGGGEAVRSGTRGVSLYAQDEVDAVVDVAAEGLYIIAASADDGFAREREGNGLFTGALLEGLSGAADSNGNGFVEIEELKDYAAGVVHEQSGGRQRPTVPTIRGGENFPLARVP